MSKDPLLLHVADGIAHITINRPKKRNAMTLEMWLDLPKLVEAAASDRSVLAIILRAL